MRHDYAADMAELDREKARSARAIALRGELLALQVAPFSTVSEAREIEKDRDWLSELIDRHGDVLADEEQVIRQRWGL